jgi:hypothetical protein
MTGNRAGQDRGAGKEFAHVAIDDASRLAYVEVLPDQKGPTAVAFLERAALLQEPRTDMNETLRTHS